MKLTAALLPLARLAAKVGPRVTLTAGEGVTLHVQGEHGRAVLTGPAAVERAGACQVDSARLLAVLEAARVEEAPLELIDSSLVVKVPGFKACLATQEAQPFALHPPPGLPLDLSFLAAVLPAAERMHGVQLEGDGTTAHAIALGTVRFARAQTPHGATFRAALSLDSLKLLRLLDTPALSTTERSVYASTAQCTLALPQLSAVPPWRAAFALESEPLLTLPAEVLRDACDRLGAAAGLRTKGELGANEEERTSELALRASGLLLAASDREGRPHAVRCEADARAEVQVRLRPRYLRAAVEPEGEAALSLVRHGGLPLALRVVCGGLETVFALSEPSHG